MIPRIEKSLNSVPRVPVDGIETGKAVRILLAMLVFAGSIIALACEKRTKDRNVMFVDRSVIFPDGEPVERQMLMVGINEDRKLSLNKFEIGTVAEIDVLAEKLKGVFDDRHRVGLKERGVIIEMHGAVQSEDLEELVLMLESIDVGPIRIVRTNRADNTEGREKDRRVEIILAK